MNKPFSEASEQNQAPILAVLQTALADSTHILEIGSGTGQHAVHFARHLPHVQWYASDVAAHLPGIRLWLDEAGLDNLHGPFALDVNQPDWPTAPSGQFDGIFSANAVHIMAWPSVEQMFAGIGRGLADGGVCCLYGPFNYAGRFTSESNARFDQWLRARDPASGIRDFEAIDALAQQAGMTLVHDHAMPVNNRTLVWKKGR